MLPPAPRESREKRESARTPISPKLFGRLRVLCFGNGAFHPPPMTPCLLNCSSPRDPVWSRRACHVYLCFRLLIMCDNARWPRHQDFVSRRHIPHYFDIFHVQRLFSNAVLQEARSRTCLGLCLLFVIALATCICIAFREQNANRYLNRFTLHRPPRSILLFEI